MGKTSGDMSHQSGRQFHDPLGNAAAVHELACEHEKRDCQQGETVGRFEHALGKQCDRQIRLALNIEYSCKTCSPGDQPLHRMVLTFSDIPGREPPFLPLPQSADPDQTPSLSKQASEYDLLTYIYRKTRTDRQTAEEFISLAVPEFERNILMQVIAEDLTDPEVIGYQLRYIKSSLQMEGSYQCFLLYSDHPAENSHVVDIILQNQASALAEQTFRSEWGQLRILRLDSTTLLLVVQYSPDLSAARIRRYQEQFSAALTPRLLELDEHLIFAAGSICSSLPAIHQSYHKARESIRESLYYQTDEPAAADTPASEEAGGMNEQYFRSQTKLLDELLQSGSLGQAWNQTAALLREVCFTEDGPEAAMSRCSKSRIPQASAALT